MQLKLKTCEVRGFKECDAGSIAALANNRKIWLNLRDAFPHPYHLRDAQQFIKMASTLEPQRIFTIALADKAVGAIGFNPGKDVECISAEIGYWLGEPYWGRGIMTEVLQAVTKYAMQKFSLTRMFALPFQWNVASFRVLEKAGYKLEGRLHNSCIKDGKIIDQLQYAFTIEPSVGATYQSVSFTTQNPENV